MAHRDIYIDQVKAMSDMLDGQVAELDDTLLRTRPGQYLNPPGFIYFHILRIWDMDINVLVGGSTPTEDAWHRGDYAETMGYNPDGKGGRGLGIGFGYTDAEVDEAPYALEPLKRYHQQLVAETLQYLNDANDEELARGITAMGQPATTGARVQHIVAHSWNHIGELRMTRSMLGFHDPTTPPRG